MMNNTAIRSFEDTLGHPQNISELTPAEWIQYLRLLARLNGGEISTKTFKVEWLSHMLRLNVLSGSQSKAEEIISSGDYYLDGFMQEIDGELILDTFSVKNNLPQYTWNNITYTGPQDLCLNLSFGRFLTAYYVFQDYTLTQNSVALKYLFAVLYSDGSLLGKRVEALGDIPNYVALSAYYFFKSVVSHISKNSVYVAGEDLPLYKVFDEAAKNSNVSKFGIEEALYDLACIGGVKINRHGLRDQNLYEVLRYVWFRMKKN